MVASISTSRIGQALLAGAPAELRAVIRAGACKDLDAAISKVTQRPRSIRTYDIDSATMIIEEITDSTVLEKIGGSDWRVGVQDALRRHKNKPAVAPRKEATKSTDQILALPFSEALAGIKTSSSVDIDGRAVLAWVRNLTGTNRTEAYRTLLQTTNAYSIWNQLGHDVYSGTVDELDDNILVNGPTPRTCALAFMCKHWEGSVPKRFADLLVRGNIDMATDRKYDLTLETAQILGASTNATHQYAAILSGHLPLDTAVALFQDLKFTSRVRGNLLTQAPNATTAEAFALALNHELRCGISTISASRALDMWSSLSTAARKNILRFVDEEDFIAWVGSTGPAGPRPGEITEVADILYDEHSDISARQLIRELNREGCPAGSAMAELWNVLYERTPRLATTLIAGRRSGHLFEKLVAALAAEFGTDTDRWEMYSSLVTDWNGTTPELLDTINMVTPRKAATSGDGTTSRSGAVS